MPWPMCVSEQTLLEKGRIIEALNFIEKEEESP
jgi:hypothetical protein